jgi:NAD(P)-dependent dehydrogenase (short-subunit alcohol dehydrogenase family)
MDLHLRDKHVLITGGSKGIGLACAKSFLEEGAKVTIAARNVNDLIKAKEMLGNIHTVSVDLKDKEQAAVMVANAIENNGPIDVLVNCAGSAKKVAPLDVEPHNYLDAMQSKFFTYINSMYAVLEVMKSGTIVNVIGYGGKVAVSTHLTGGAANAALMLSTIGMANVYASKGIRINCVNPVATNTDMLTRQLEVYTKMNGTTMEEELEKARARFPIGRILEPTEVADSVLFLASDRSSYINGSCIYLDGGELVTI